MDRRRRNLVIGLSGVAAAAAGGSLLLGDGDGPKDGPRAPGGASDPEGSDVTQHGAVGDGVADDTRAIEAAIEAALGETGSLRGGRIVFPKGVYRITRTLTIEQAAAVVEGVGWSSSRPNGAGSRGSVLAWDGPAGVPMLRLDYCSGTSVSGLRFVGKSTSKPSAAISLRHLESHPNGSNFNTLSSLWIGRMGDQDTDSSSHQFATGILLEGDDVDGGSNRFETISIMGCDTGVRITRPRFVRNHFSSLRIGDCDTAFETNARISTSGTNWVLSGSTRTDIALGRGARLRVKGFASEMGARLAVSDSSSLTIRDGYWQMGPRTAPDGIVIDGRNGSGRSFLRLEDLDFTNEGATVPGRIMWQPDSQVFLTNFAGPENRP